MTATVSRLPAADRPARKAPQPARKPAPTKAERQAETAQARRQRLSAVAVAGVSAVMVGVSLSHLAHGIDTVAHVGTLDAWSTAVAIDLGFVSLEAAALCTTGPAAATVAKWAKPAVGAMMLLSALLNAMAYTAGAVGTASVILSAAVGIALPGLIYVATRVLYAQLSGKGA